MTTNEPATATLTCPKCAGSMRAYERNGVTIDQCTECRGIFLDRGELERLIEAEDVHYGRADQGGPQRDDRYPDRGDPDPGYPDTRDRGGKHGGGGEHGGGGGSQRRRRGGFLGDLIDFG